MVAVQPAAALPLSPDVDPPEVPCRDPREHGEGTKAGCGGEHGEGDEDPLDPEHWAAGSFAAWRRWMAGVGWGVQATKATTGTTRSLVTTTRPRTCAQARFDACTERAFRRAFRARCASSHRSGALAGLRSRDELGSAEGHDMRSCQISIRVFLV